MAGVKPRPLPAVTVRLSYALFWAGLRRSTGQALAATVATVAGAGAVSLSLILAAGLRSIGVRGAAITVAAFALLTVFWTLFSLVVGSDSALAPSRFATLPLAPKPLARALLGAAFVAPSALVLWLLAGAQVLAWSFSWATTLAACLAGILGVITIVLASRVIIAVLGTLMRTRQGRVLGAVVVLLVNALPFALNLALGRGSATPVGMQTLDLRPQAGVAQLVPMGWAWALPFDVAESRLGLAVGHLALALALIGLLVWVWERRVAAALTSPPTVHRAAHLRERPAQVAMGRSPQWRTVAGRRLRAWRRDPRLLTLTIRFLSLPVIVIVLSTQGPFSATPAGVGLILMGLGAGTALGSDLAYDGAAWWLDVSAGVVGWHDRLGRLLALATIQVPVIVAAFAFCVALGLLDSPGRWAGAVIASFGASACLGLVQGALHPGVAPRPGDNPFSSPPGSAGVGCLLGLVGLFGPIILAGPIWAAAMRAPAGAGLVVLAGAVLYAAALITLGVVVGGRLLDRRAPEILATLVSMR